MEEQIEELERKIDLQEKERAELTKMHKQEKERLLEQI